MPYATIENLRNTLHEIKGEITIGDATTSTLTTEQAEELLRTAHAKLVCVTGLRNITDEDKLVLAKRLECLYVAKMLALDLWKTDIQAGKFDNLDKEIKELEHLLKGSMSPSVANEDYFNPQYSIWSL